MSDLNTLVSNIAPLDGAILADLRNGYAYSSWQRPGREWDVEQAAAQLCKFVGDCDTRLAEIRCGAPTRLVVHSTDSVVIIDRLGSAAALFAFRPETAVGIAYHFVDSLAGKLDNPPALDERRKLTMPVIPTRQDRDIVPQATADTDGITMPLVAATNAASQRPRVPIPPPTSLPDLERFEVVEDRRERVLRCLTSDTQDNHATLVRISLQTGLPLKLLRAPSQLSDDEFEQVADSVYRICGLNNLGN